MFKLVVLTNFWFVFFLENIIIIVLSIYFCIVANYMDRQTDYGRIMTTSQNLYSPIPNRKSCKMYENLCFLQKNGLVIQNHVLGTKFEKNLSLGVLSQ